MYRTMQQSLTPKFNYTERLVLSGRWYNIAWANIINLVKHVGLIVGISSVIILAGAALLAVLVGLIALVSYIIQSCHIDVKHGFIYLVSLFVVILLTRPILDFCKNNKKDIEASIQRKLAKENNHERS